MNVRKTLMEHLKARRLAETASGWQNKHRDSLKDFLVKHGDEEDPETGHRWLRFDDEPFVDHEGNQVAAIKAERRCPIVFDEDAAWEMVNGLPAELREKVVHVETIESIDEDALLALAFEDKVPDSDVKSLYRPGKETWAFKVIR